jgi:hypothetical protein
MDAKPRRQLSVSISRMQSDLSRVLATRRSQLRQRWELRLRAERMSSPLANPDALIHLMDWTLDRIFAQLNSPQGRTEARHRAAHCACGLNPLLVYFAIAEAVLVEALHTEQVRHRPEFALQYDSELARLKQAIVQVANREIAAFCAVCQHSGEMPVAQCTSVGCSRSR